ncbi:zwei Ig domain protein zig-8-like [Artemia franciscana]|uniref:Ig-like domain-containing protein n=1 Tax=Artemia franciscana TaxID=6661 RepID=A0AA88IEW6_ARTSF|nr:hypothetical protein QYM36_000080 [Artemia franciscana]
MMKLFLWILALVEMVSLAYTNEGGSELEATRDYFTGPSFDISLPTISTVAAGQTAYLQCKVRLQGDRKVSWIRQRDLHILTVGTLTYTNDARFSAVHVPGTDTWTLRLKPVQVRDAGTYECQVSSEPKISRSVLLNVVVAKAKIGPPELFIKVGSDINLTCLAPQSSEPPSFITWHHAGQVLNFVNRPRLHIDRRTVDVSRLIIKNANPNDSGNYTCSPDGVEPASVFVHVLSGEHPAAMQHGSATPSASSLIVIISILMILVTSL